MKKTEKAFVLLKNCVEHIIREKTHMEMLDSPFVVNLLHTF